MKRELFYVRLFLCMLCGLAANGHAEERFFWVTVSNEWDRPKENEPVVLDIKELQCGFDVASAVVTEVGGEGGALPAGDVASRQSTAGVASLGGNAEVASQLDDLDGDLQADEIVFVTDVPAHSAKTFRVMMSSDEKQKSYPPRVYAEMLVSDKNGRHVPILSLTIPGTSDIYNQLHHHGPAFESELTAYRIYFDRKQTVDIYGKFNKGFELEESQFYPTDEQLARGFGDDVLLVGGSCGLGTLKGWDGTKATHITPVESLTESILARGPVRTVVEVVSTGWQYQGAVLQMRVRYILYGGHRDCEVQVSFDRPLRQELFSTGVVHIKGSVSYSDHKGLIACWGTDWPVNDTIKYAKETVGLATCLPQEELIRSEIHDRVNYLYQIGAEGKRGFTYYITFTSMKETFGYKTAEAWFDFAWKWKESLQHPCTVTVKR